MKLPDFDECFDPLLKRMGAERKPFGVAKFPQLATRGIDVPAEEIRPVPDGTIHWNGLRVLVYIREQTVRGRDDGAEAREILETGVAHGFRFHVAYCKTLKKMRKEGRYDRYVATNRKDGRFVVDLKDVETEQVWSNQLLEMQVCANCLEVLGWENFSIRKTSRSEKDRIIGGFSPDEFFDEYGQIVDDVPLTG